MMIGLKEEDTLTKLFKSMIYGKIKINHLLFYPSETKVEKSNLLYYLVLIDQDILSQLNSVKIIQGFPQYNFLFCYRCFCYPFFY